MAPQLAQEPDGSGPHASGGDAEPTRSPEQIRGLMSAFQQGTNRGRQEGDPAGAPGQSTTSEE